MAISPSLGGSRQHKRNNINNGDFHSILLAMTRDPAEFGWHCWSNTAHFPPSSTLTSLHRCHLPYCPYHRVASIKQQRGNSRCQSELRHNHSPLIPIPSTLTCLPYIHPPIIQALFTPSIHPNLGLPLALLPSTFAFITFFSSRSLSILST